MMMLVPTARPLAAVTLTMRRLAVATLTVLLLAPSWRARRPAHARLGITL
jgi:hypothetical protein